MKQRILIVEDDDDIGKSLRILLEGEGYQVEIARNGRLALNFLKEVQEVPSLILLDLMMPEMDGFQFRAEQKRHPRLAKIPVIIMSAAGQIEANTERLGANGSLRKPLDIDDVLTAIAIHATKPWPGRDNAHDNASYP
ncbi:MAG: response regulator [Bdellovibrionales bacterium]